MCIRLFAGTISEDFGINFFFPENLLFGLWTRVDREEIKWNGNVQFRGHHQI